MKNLNVWTIFLWCVEAKRFSYREFSRSLFWFEYIFQAETNHPNVTRFSYKVPSYTFVSLLCYTLSIKLIRRVKCCSLSLRTKNSLSMKSITVSMILIRMITLLLVAIR